MTDRQFSEFIRLQRINTAATVMGVGVAGIALVIALVALLF